MLSSEELSKKWGVSPCLIRRLARQGRIPGAKLCGRTWTFPDNAQKPADERTRTAKEHELPIEDDFRCVCYEFRKEESFNPPLSAEELTLKQAFEDFYACRYKDADKRLGDMPETATNRYLRIGALYCGCMTDVVLCNVNRFLLRYDRLCSEFSGDFPHKVEMMEYIYGVRSLLGEDSYYQEKFAVDSSCSYDTSFLPRLANLSTVQFTLANEDLNVSGLRSSELNCILLESSDAYADVASMHVNLGLAYGALSEVQKRDYHFKKAFDIAKEHEIYFPIVMQLYFSRKMFASVLEEFPLDFRNLLLRLSDDFHNRFTRFMEEISEDSVYMSLRPDDIIFVQYAMQGLTNKEVAKLLGVAVGNVGKRYGDIYAALGVTKKSEMLERYNASLGKVPLSRDSH